MFPSSRPEQLLCSGMVVSIPVLAEGTPRMGVKALSDHWFPRGCWSWWMSTKAQSSALAVHRRYDNFIFLPPFTPVQTVPFKCSLCHWVLFQPRLDHQVRLMLRSQFADKKPTEEEKKKSRLEGRWVGEGWGEQFC